NTLECLERLRESSLVLVEETEVRYSVFGVRYSDGPIPNTEHRTPNTDTRFRLLETLREYAAEQLDPAERVELSRRHASYYLALVEQAQPALKGPEQQHWVGGAGEGDR